MLKLKPKKIKPKHWNSKLSQQLKCRQNCKTKMLFSVHDRNKQWNKMKQNCSNHLCWKDMTKFTVHWICQCSMYPTAILGLKPKQHSKCKYSKQISTKISFFPSHRLLLNFPYSSLVRHGSQLLWRKPHI